MKSHWQKQRGFGATGRLYIKNKTQSEKKPSYKNNISSKPINLLFRATTSLYIKKKLHLSLYMSLKEAPFEGGIGLPYRDYYWIFKIQSVYSVC